MKHFAAIFLVGAIFLGTACAEKIKTYQDCGTDKTVINEINVIPCPVEPCKLKSGTNVSLELKFTPKTPANQLRGVVYGVISGIDAPFPLPNDDGCRSVGCPTEAGKMYTYKETLYVDPLYPKISLKVKWQLFDENKKMLWCFVIPASVIA